MDSILNTQDRSGNIWKCLLLYTYIVCFCCLCGSIINRYDLVGMGMSGCSIGMGLNTRQGTKQS